MNVQHNCGSIETNSEIKVMRKLLLAISFTAFFLTACGAAVNSRGNEGFQSGRRLRARVFDGGSGARLFRRWHDTVLNEDCSFNETTPGHFHCVPGTAQSHFYLDAN